MIDCQTVTMLVSGSVTVVDEGVSVSDDKDESIARVKVNEQEVGWVD